MQTSFTSYSFRSFGLAPRSLAVAALQGIASMEAPFRGIAAMATRTTVSDRSVRSAKPSR
jgi:hypothetical protein